MKWFVALLVLVALAAVPMAFMRQSTSFGISSKHPMGTLDAFDDYLGKKKKLPRTEGEFALADCPSREVYEYLNSLEVTKYTCDAHSRVAVHLFVLVAQDDKGEVQAVFAQFGSGARGYSTLGPPPESFMARYWVALAGQEPDFDVANEPGAIRWNEFMLAKFGTAKVAGQWLKKPTSGNVDHTNTIYDRVMVLRR